MGIAKRVEQERDNAIREYLDSGGAIKRLPDGSWTKLRPPPHPWEVERRRFSKMLQRRKAWLKAELAEVENRIERMQRATWRPDQADRIIEKKESRRLNGRRKNRRR